MPGPAGHLSTSRSVTWCCDSPREPDPAPRRSGPGPPGGCSCLPRRTRS
jgi:hypothetical protein